MKTLGIVALGAVIVQGLLGGLTVKLMLPPAVSISHACLAQLFFSTTVAIARFHLEKLAARPRNRRGSRLALAAHPRHRHSGDGAGADRPRRGVPPSRHRSPAAHPLLDDRDARRPVRPRLSCMHQFPDHRALSTAAKALLGVTLRPGNAGRRSILHAHCRPLKQPLAMVLTTVAHVATGGLTWPPASSCPSRFCETSAPTARSTRMRR